MLESFRRDLSPPQRHPPPPDTGSAAALPPSVAGSPLGRTEPPSDPSSRDCRISVLEASRGRAIAASDALPSGRRPPRHSVWRQRRLSRRRTFHRGFGSSSQSHVASIPSPVDDVHRVSLPRAKGIPRSIPSQPCGRCPPRIIAACKGAPHLPCPPRRSVVLDLVEFVDLCHVRDGG
jgi:hypothetical protein